MFPFSLSSPNTSYSCHGNNPGYITFFSCKQCTLNRSTIKILDLRFWVRWSLSQHRRCGSHYKCNTHRWVDNLSIALLIVSTNYHHAHILSTVYLAVKRLTLVFLSCLPQLVHMLWGCSLVLSTILRSKLPRSRVFGQDHPKQDFITKGKLNVSIIRNIFPSIQNY